MIGSVFRMQGLHCSGGYSKESYSHNIGKKRAGRQLNGERHDAFPHSEYPKN